MSRRLRILHLRRKQRFLRDRAFSPETPRRRHHLNCWSIPPSSIVTLAGARAKRLDCFYGIWPRLLRHGLSPFEEIAHLVDLAPTLIETARLRMIKRNRPFAESSTLPSICGTECAITAAAQSGRVSTISRSGAFVRGTSLLLLGARRCCTNCRNSSTFAIRTSVEIFPVRFRSSARTVIRFTRQGHLAELQHPPQTCESAKGCFMALRPGPATPQDRQNRR